MQLALSDSQRREAGRAGQTESTRSLVFGPAPQQNRAEGQYADNLVDVHRATPTSRKGYRSLNRAALAVTSYG